MADGDDLVRRAAEAAHLPSRYGEPQRRYHDLAHVHHVLGVVETLAMLAADLTVVQLAAWFHDAVYDPTRDDNEPRSAELAAATLLGLGCDHVLVTEVGRLVLLTATHDPDPADRNGMVLCDADLSILGAEPDRYDAYASAVRQEYSHVPEPLFRAGRSRILTELLARPHLFSTHWGRATLEEPARRNLARELASLAP